MNSPKPERKAQAAGWRIFKGSQLAQGNAVYMHAKSNQSSRVRSTSITQLIAEVFPVEVQEPFSKHRDAFGGTHDHRPDTGTVDASVMAMDPVRIWVAIALGTALSTVARREGHRLIARADAQWLAPYCRLLPITASIVFCWVFWRAACQLPLRGGCRRPASVCGRACFFGFAAFSAANGNIETNTYYAWHRFVSKCGAW